MERSTKDVHRWTVRANKTGGTVCGIMSVQTTVADHEVTCEDCLAKLCVDGVKLTHFFKTRT